MSKDTVTGAGSQHLNQQPPPASEHGSASRTAERAAGGQTLISCPPVIANSGVDTLLLTFSASVPKELILKLKEEKAAVQETIGNCAFVPFGETKFFAWNLQRMGAQFYPYILKTGDVTLGLSARDSDSSIPSMQLSIGSISCNNNLPDLLKTFRKWCRLHGIVIKEEKVSRVDLFCDVVVPIESLRLWNQAKFVTRAEKFACYYSNRKMTGCQIGSGDIVCRMYDKIQEMTDKQSSHKMEFFQSIWGNVENLTRCEFQLRRGAVKSLCPGVSDFKTFSKRIPEVWKYLTVDWFRQTAKAVDRLNRHQHRETTSVFWSVVQTAFNAPFHQAATRNRKQKTINIKGLVKQAAGIMLTVCAGLGHVSDDLFGIFATSAQMIQDRLLTVMDSPDYDRSFDSRVVDAVVSF